MTTATIRAQRRRQVVRDELVDVAWELANEGGVGAVTLKNVADRMDVKSPSLYEYVPNLHGLFDLMFRSGWAQLGDLVADIDPKEVSARAAYRRVIDFCVESPARFQLMLQRPIPGFVPSKDAFAVSQATYDAIRELLAHYGITRQQDVDLVDSMLLGLVGNQIANEPGGDRFIGLADEAVDLLIRNAKRRGRT